MEKCGSYLKTPFLYVFVLALMLSSTPCFGATIRVPADYQLIQTAIDAASDGDTVLVDDGTYKGTGNTSLDFRNKAITVKSENGPQNCIIDCEGKGSGFRFYGEEAQSVLSGFTITNCQRGINCTYASPSISNCIIRGNTYTEGAGISCYKSSPTITNSIISDNSASVVGGGIYNCAGTITNSIISDNSASSGGGIYGSATITNSTISGNSAWSGGAIHGSDIKISNSRIMNNSSRRNGGAINGYVNITNSVISGNSASSYGAGIYSPLCSSLIITNSTFSNNTTGVSAGAIFCEGGIATITNSILWGDSLPEVAPSRDSFAVTYSDVQGGHIGTGNIDADPQFVGNGDYHLTSSSPCIDAGTSEGATDHDIDGDSRPQGAGYDMGADEYVTDTAELYCVSAQNGSNTSGDGSISSPWQTINYALSQIVASGAQINIQITGDTYIENIIVDKNSGIFKLIGGCDESFQSCNTLTVIKGTLDIWDETIVAENIVLAP